MKDHKIELPPLPKPALVHKDRGNLHTVTQVYDCVRAAVEADRQYLAEEYRKELDKLSQKIYEQKLKIRDLKTDRQRRGEPVKLQHMAVSESGKLRWMSGRQHPAGIDSVELYAMPDFGNAPTLYTAPQPAEPQNDKLNLDRLADYIADNWPDKKYSLEEIAQRLHATWPSAFVPAEPAKTPTNAKIRAIAICDAGMHQDDDTAEWTASDDALLRFARALIDL